MRGSFGDVQDGDEREIPDVEAEILVDARLALYLPVSVPNTITIVVQTLDRNENLARMLASLRAATLPEDTDAQLIVASFDDPDSEIKALAEAHGAQLVPAPGQYSRAAGRNIGAKWADGGVIVFLDADMVVPPGFFHAVVEEVKPGRAFFPICRDAKPEYDYDAPPEEQKNNLGRARPHGYGSCAFVLQDWLQVGPWNEDRTAWGREDADLYQRACEALGDVVRYELVGLIHQDHPRDEGYLNRHCAPVSEDSPLTLLVKFPTRGRPEQFFKVLDVYIEKLSGKYAVKFLVSCDKDDETMNTPAVRKRLKGYGRTVRYRFGDNPNKIAAVNADMGRAWKCWDVMLLASDDMIPEADGYDATICERMRRYFPDLDGVLWFNDGYTGKKLNTLSIMGRAYYERFNYLYSPAYKSIWADNEFMDVANLLGRQVYFEDVIIRHAHPCNAPHEAKKDGTYDLNSKYDAADGVTYLVRKAAGFDLKLLPILSVLVCTLESRAAQFGKLNAALLRQAQATLRETGRTVEVLSECDDGAVSIGAKRNTLMCRARGDYICFVDDDDKVDEEYVSLIVAAARKGAPDCVGIVGKIKDGGKWRQFVHSIRYAKYWSDRAGRDFRPPNHLNPVKREIAIRYPFQDTDWAEDYDYAMHLAEDDVLKTEVMLEKPVYFYEPSDRHKG